MLAKKTAVDVGEGTREATLKLWRDEKADFCKTFNVPTHYHRTTNSWLSDKRINSLKYLFYITDFLRQFIPVAATFTMRTLAIGISILIVVFQLPPPPHLPLNNQLSPSALRKNPAIRLGEYAPMKFDFRNRVFTTT